MIVSPINIIIAFVLEQLGALAIDDYFEERNPYDGELTFLGKVLAQLPVNQHLGKLIVLGHVFGCLEETLIIGKSTNTDISQLRLVIAYKLFTIEK